MSVPRPAKKRNTGLLVIMLVIMLLLIAEGAVLVIAFVSPSGSRAISDDIAKAQRAWEGTEGSPGIRQRTGEGLSDFYQDQVRTLWAIPKSAPAATTFAKCSPCHQDYETKVRFPGVYMDHPVHAEAGVSCASCHTDVQHPNPAPPVEAVCAKCHEQVSRPKQCDFCHPPGSLPHFFLLGYPRSQAVDCATCHPPESFKQAVPSRLVHPGTFDGAQKGICLQCHQYQDSASYGRPACLDCHSQQHPPNWANDHGIASGVAFEGQAVCAICHPSSAWCAAQCHPYEAPTAKYPLPKEVPSS